MSDSEPVAAEGPVSEGQDASWPTTPDTATDVAPTRRAKRRPEPKAAEEPEEAPNTEEQPAQVHVNRWHENIQRIIGVPRKARPLSCFVCPRPSPSADSCCVSGRLGLLGQLGKINLIHSNKYCGHCG